MGNGEAKLDAVFGCARVEYAVEGAEFDEQRMPTDAAIAFVGIVSIAYLLQIRMIFSKVDSRTL